MAKKTLLELVEEAARQPVPDESLQVRPTWHSRGSDEDKRRHDAAENDPTAEMPASSFAWRRLAGR
jgi:hypothetical protein